MDTLRDAALFAGRVLIAFVFVYDAWLIYRLPGPTAAYLSQFGVPGFLTLPAAGFQVAGAALIIFGWQTRAAALGFALFCLATAVIFHLDPAKSDSMIQFGKDLAMAGGFLFLAAAGAGQWSVDAAQGRP